MININIIPTIVANIIMGIFLSFSEIILAFFSLSLIISSNVLLLEFLYEISILAGPLNSSNKS